MIIQRAYKTELDPNNVQKTLLIKHAGTARFAWNWALARIKDKISKPNAIELHRELNALKPTDFPWMYEVSKCAPQEALRNLQIAFQRFFKENKSGKKAGFPKFKSKHKNKSSFKLTGTINIEDRRIQLPRLGWLKLKEHGYLPKEAKILSATCSEHAGKWFVSVSVQEEINPKVGVGTIGIDLGIKTLATCSDGTVFENPKAFVSNQKTLKKLQKRHTRQKKGSKRKDKTRQRIARLHYRITCIRKDASNKATSWVAKIKRPEFVILENLNVKGMLKNRKLSKTILDASFNEFRFQMTYKQNWNGGSVIKADRFFPSSKSCSECGCVKENLKLSERTYVCDCGMTKDRDLNAAINLEKYGMVFLKGKAKSVSSTANAHGGATVVNNSCEVRSKQEICSN
jgi:putative transposase